MEKVKELFTDHDTGIYLATLFMKNLVEEMPEYCVSDFLGVDGCTTTKSRSMMKLGRNKKPQKWKEYTTVFNHNNTLLVLDYEMPCDVSINVSDVSIDWHLVHFEKKRSFATGSVIDHSASTKTRSYDTDTSKALLSIPKTTCKLCKRRSVTALANIDIGLALLQICIRQFLYSHDDPKFQIEDFINPGPYTTTKAHARTDGSGKKWKDFTTIMKKPLTIFVLDYTLPCDVTVQTFDVRAKWRVIHCDNTNINFKWQGDAVVARLSGMFVTSKN